MPSHDLGRTLIIANPASHSGKGEAAALFATRFFSSFQTVTDICEVMLTEGPGDGLHMAETGYQYDTVIALGGDGIIHEVVNGLMCIDKELRPRLGIIPMGSGNDFARTIRIRKNDPERAISELLQSIDKPLDLGKVNDVYFMQTLSFGVDAAIALDTTDRRAENTKQMGAGLFVTSGIKLISHGMRGWKYKAQIDDEHIEGIDVAFAVQNGPTYGGGFRICPDAVPNDGLLDICFSTTRPSTPHSLALFGLARFGKHTKSKRLHMRQARHVEIDFLEEQPPCQVDGERLEANRYIIDVVPKALRVFVSPTCSW